MYYWRRAFHFALAVQTGRRPEAEVAKTELLLQGRRVPCEVYRPPGDRPTRGTVLSVHGMTVYGHLDPRIVTLCEMMTLFNYTVVNPSFEEIQALQIETSTIDHVGQAVLAILEDPSLCPPSGRVGILAHSFSAGMSLVTSSRPAYRDSVAALCSIGGYYNLDAAPRNLFASDDDVNHYPRDVLLYNFLHHSTGPNLALKKTFRIALEDNGFERDEPLLPAHLETLEPADRDLFLALRNDPNVRMAHFERIRPHIDHLVSSLDDIHQVEADVVLIHGVHDTVAPPSETRLIHQRLQAQGVRSRLDLTPLLDHGGPSLRLHLIPAVIRTLGAFAAFFRAAAK